MEELSKEYISALIEQQGMTKAEFAEKMGYARTNLDVMLAAKKKDIKTVVKMSEVLGIPLLDFISLQGVENKDKIQGCVFVNSTPHIIKNKKDIESLLAELK